MAGPTSSAIWGNRPCECGAVSVRLECRLLDLEARWTWLRMRITLAFGVTYDRLPSAVDNVYTYYYGYTLFKNKTCAEARMVLITVTFSTG
jgi:hypothetical protein